MRKYLYHIKKSSFDGENRWNVYVQADRRFSLKEMLAKQHWVLHNIVQLPFNQCEVKMASCREGSTSILVILEPNSSAFHFDTVSINKLNHTVILDYDFVLEFVFSRKNHVKPFLELLQNHWKGEWVKDHVKPEAR